MYHFLLQVNKNKEILYDFQLSFIQLLNMQRNIRELNYTYEYLELNQLNSFKKETNIKYIPLGSMEFVNEFIVLHEENKIIRKPIYIPKELMKNEYLKRKVEVKKGNSFHFERDMFIKSIESYKDFTDLGRSFVFEEEKEMVISEPISIISEYRCFIFEKRIISVNHYDGDFFQIPTESVIKEMIHDYKTSPTAYTLDVGVLETGETVLIEVHPMVSCGLYGAYLGNYYIPMLIQGYNYYKGN